MALKKGFIKRDILDPYDFVFAMHFDDTIHKQKRVAMREIFENLFNVEHVFPCYMT